MKTAIETFLLVSLVGIINGVTYPTCSNSLPCDPNTCCRDSDGRVLTSDLHGGLLLVSGTCMPGHAQEGEMCGGVCQCDSGLECYRPLTGVCCAPLRCYDAQWVQEQREYWANCIKDPKCELPSKARPDRIIETLTK